MKRKVIILFLYFGASQYSDAQIRNIKVDEHTTLDKLYAGLYPRWLSSTDSLGFRDQVSFRVGARVTHHLNDIFSFNAQSALQMENNVPVLPIIDYALLTNISKQLQLRLGSFATPNTLLRPNPIDWQGHTETYAQSRIIPGRSGALLAYKLDDRQNLNLGYHYQNEVWATHIMYNIGNAAVSGWVQNDGEYFGHLDFDNDKIIATLNYGSIHEELATSLFYQLTERYTVYTDLNYRTVLEESEVTRFGVRSYFQNDSFHVKGFLALQYDVAAELVSAELFIHLN